MQVHANDDDEGFNSMVVYAIYDINGQSTTAVSINSTSGLVTADITFDRESRDLYEFLVTSSDQGQPVSRSSSVLVRLEISDEDDERPTFPYGVYTFGTYENQPSGTEVGTLTAIDRDLAPYNEAQYHLQESGNGAFEISRHTGRITTTQLLDRENKSEYHLTVVASQHGAEVDMTASSTTRVKILVADRNDNQPQFVFPAVANDSVPVATCRARVGTPITRIIARDRDIGANAALRYQLLSDLTFKQQTFDVNPLSGIVTARKKLDDAMYPLHVQVRDTGSPPLVADTWLNVIVNCSGLAVAQRPPPDVINRSQMGGMLVVVVMATIASALLLICILTGTLVLRHCVATTARKPATNQMNSAGSSSSSSDRDDLRLKISRDVMISRDYRHDRCPPSYSSLQPQLPPTCITNMSVTTPIWSSVGRIRPVNGQSDHMTLNGRSLQVPVTSSFSDDIRHYLLYGNNVAPAVRHPVRIAVCLFLYCNVLASKLVRKFIYST